MSITVCNDKVSMEDLFLCCKPQNRLVYLRKSIYNLQNPANITIMSKTIIDNIDIRILDILQRDGRTAYTEIAHKLGISEGTVRNRVVRLIEEKILQIIGLVNPIPLGFEAPAMIGISVQPRLLENVAATIAGFDEVSYLIMVSGEFDLFVEVLCRDRDHLASFLNNQIMQVDGVVRTQTFISLRTYKMAHRALPISPEYPDNE